MERKEDITIYGCEGANYDNHTSTICINIKDMAPKTFEQILLDQYNIVVRAGFHCSSGTHHTIGTLDRGAVRISLGYTNTKEQIE